MPDTAALTRTFFSLATATQTEPEVVNQWTLLFKRSPRAPAFLQPQIEVLLEVRHWSGMPPTAWTGSGTETGMWLSSKIKVRDQALVPGMCTTTSFLTSGHLQTMRETNVCTLPVFFQTWGKRDGDTGNCGPAPWDALCTFEGVQDQLTEAYNTMAYVAQPSKVAPAGEAWRTYPDRNSLFSIDGSHASCRGTFLAAATIFRVRKSWQSTIKAIILLNYEHCTYCLSLSKSGGCQPPPAPTNTNGSKMLQL